MCIDKIIPWDIDIPIAGKKKTIMKTLEWQNQYGFVFWAAYDVFLVLLCVYFFRKGILLCYNNSFVVSCEATPLVDIIII